MSDVSPILVGGVVTLASSGIAAIVAIITSKRTSKGSIESMVNERIKIVLDASEKGHEECRAKVTILENSIFSFQHQLREALQFSASLISTLRRENIRVPKSADATLKRLLDRHDATLLPLLKEHDNG